jgi:hypothetical protein
MVREYYHPCRKVLKYIILLKKIENYFKNNHAYLLYNMPDYSKTIIYKIVCKDINIKETYGGHTTHMIKRRQSHKYSCNNENDMHFNYYVYKFIREHGGWDNWDVIWQYDFPCKTKREAELEERSFIEKEQCQLNSYRPFVTEEERKKLDNENSRLYKIKNKDNPKYKESKKISDKKYREKNIDKIAENNKEYYEKNKDNPKYKETIEKYRLENKDKIAEQRKEYYEKNKQELLAKQNIKYTCICGSTLSINNKPRHERTQKHIKYCEQI